MKRTYEMLVKMKEEEEQSDGELDSDDDDELAARLEGIQNLCIFSVFIYDRASKYVFIQKGRNLTCA